MKRTIIVVAVGVLGMLILAGCSQQTAQQMQALSQKADSLQTELDNANAKIAELTQTIETMKKTAPAESTEVEEEVTKTTTKAAPTKTTTTKKTGVKKTTGKKKRIK